jgi:hypothetical protein
MEDLNELQRLFRAAICSRHSQKLSLSDSYQLACEYANLIEDHSAQYQQLIEITLEMLILVDRFGTEDQDEPEYHNRQHFSDAMLAMGFFVGAIEEFSSYEKRLLILVMLLHDFGHRGIANKIKEISHEQETINLLRNTALVSLPQPDIDFIEKCILATSPENLVELSKRIAKNPMDHLLICHALVRDADIAASFIDELGAELSKQILLESGTLDPTQQEIEETLNSFKSKSQPLTKIARLFLGLSEVN